MSENIPEDHVLCIEHGVCPRAPPSDAGTIYFPGGCSACEENFVKKFGGAEVKFIDGEGLMKGC